MKEQLKISKLIDNISVQDGQPFFEIKGVELAKHGFNIGDFVNVSLSDNQIVISKDKQTNKLQEMEKINPSIKLLVKKFGLSVEI